MILDPSLTLEAVLSGAITTSQPEFHVDYVLYNKEGALTKPAPFRGALNSTTDVTLLAPPQQGFIAEVRGASIYNKDTVAATVTVKTTDGTDRIIHRAVLATLESLHYEYPNRWYSLDANGAEKAAIAQLPQTPLFLAYNSADDANQTGAGTVATVDFDTVVFSAGNFAGDTFTAPVGGKFLLSTGVQVSAIPAGCTSGLVQILTSNRAYQVGETFVAATYTIKSFSLSVIADMDAGDTAAVRVQFSGGAGDTATVEGSSTLLTYFSGVRVG